MGDDQAAHLPRGSPAARAAAAPRRELGLAFYSHGPRRVAARRSGMFANLAAKASKGVVGARVKSWSLYGWSLKPWLIPLAGIAGWCVYPALTPEFKGDIKRRITDEDD